MLHIGLSWPIILFTYLPDVDDEVVPRTKKVKLEILTAVTIKILILRDMTSCSLVVKYRRFGGSCKCLK